VSARPGDRGQHDSAVKGCALLPRHPVTQVHVDGLSPTATLSLDTQAEALRDATGCEVVPLKRRGALIGEMGIPGLEAAVEARAGDELVDAGGQKRPMNLERLAAPEFKRPTLEGHRSNVKICHFLTPPSHAYLWDTTGSDTGQSPLLTRASSRVMQRLDAELCNAIALLGDMGEVPGSGTAMGVA